MKKRQSFPHQFLPPPWFEPLSSRSLSLRRASAHCSIKISYEQEQNLIIETTFTYVFCIFLQKNCNWKYIFVFNYKIIAYWPRSYIKSSKCLRFCTIRLYLKNIFLHIFAKELQLKIYFCTQLQNDCNNLRSHTNARKIHKYTK